MFQSYTSKQGVDIEKVMSYPLSPISIPFCTSDGMIRKQLKAIFYDSAMGDLKIVDHDQLMSTPINKYFLDLVSESCGTNGTIRDLTWKILDIPKQYNYLFSMRYGSIKGGGECKR